MMIFLAATLVAFGVSITSMILSKSVQLRDFLLSDPQSGMAYFTCEMKATVSTAPLRASLMFLSLYANSIYLTLASSSWAAPSAT